MGRRLAMPGALRLARSWLVTSMARRTCYRAGMADAEPTEHDYKLPKCDVCDGPDGALVVASVTYCRGCAERRGAATRARSAAPKPVLRKCVHCAAPGRCNSSGVCTDCSARGVVPRHDRNYGANERTRLNAIDRAEADARHKRTADRRDATVAAAQLAAVIPMRAPRG